MLYRVLKGSKKFLMSDGSVYVKGTDNEWKEV